MIVKIITDNTDIKNIFKELKKSNLLGIDTEFIREKTYYPILSLIQVAVNNNVFIFDCVKENKNLKILREILKDDKYVKIFHDSEQDIEIINDFFNIDLKNYFDTQLANAFLDEELSISYKKLVSRYLNINIDKEQQTSNWLRRPLNKKQIKYAANDVIYLEQIYSIILNQLKNEKKHNWFIEEQKKIRKNILYKKDENNSWEKIKLNDNANIDEKLLMKISKFREKISRERNIPKNWFLRDRNIIRLSSKLIKNIGDLKNENLTSNRFFSDYDYQLLYKNFSGHKLNLKKIKSYKYDIKTHQKILENISKKLNISQFLIANKKDLENHFGQNKVKINGWRKKIFEDIKAKTKE
tara:strand:- start:7067 stop:8128 length:1062 start_codon:yes stop_codon:yes gene_type:complete